MSWAEKDPRGQLERAGCAYKAGSKRRVNSEGSTELKISGRKILIYDDEV